MPELRPTPKSAVTRDAVIIISTTTARINMAFIHEYPCGCIVHQLAGNIRRCSGMTSRSLSGKMIKSDGESRHNDAIANGKTVNTWEVADILP